MPEREWKAKKDSKPILWFMEPDDDDMRNGMARELGACIARSTNYIVDRLENGDDINAMANMITLSQNIAKTATNFGNRVLSQEQWRVISEFIEDEVSDVVLMKVPKNMEGINEES